MHRYEILWILPGEASEEECEASVSRTSEMVTDNGGEVHSAALWGRRNLSYPIEKRTEGAYYVATFSADASAVVAIDGLMTADQGVLRHLIVRADEVKADKKDAGGSRDNGKASKS